MSEYTSIQKLKTRDNITSLGNTSISFKKFISSVIKNYSLSFKTNSKQIRRQNEELLEQRARGHAAGTHLLPHFEPHS